MSLVLLSTATATTDGEANMVWNQSRLTDVLYKLTNPSSSSATYRIVSGNEDYTSLTVRSAETTFLAGQNTWIYAVDLERDTTYNFFLQRSESGTWIRQGDMHTVTTLKYEGMNVSTSSTQALITWDKYGAGDISVIVREKDTNINVFTTSKLPYDTQYQKFRLALSNLSNTKTYKILIRQRQYTLNNAGQVVGTYTVLENWTEFTPSAYANLDVDGVYCSYIELSWDDGEVGDDEEDGEAEFRITRQDPSGTWDTVMDWTPDTTKTFSDTGLVPGAQYTYKLFRKGVNGATVFQEGSEQVITTKTTTINSGAYWSTKIQFAWAEPYDGAGSLLRFKFTPEGGQTTSGTTSPTRKWRENLNADTNHTFELYIVENGEEVLLDTNTRKTDKYAQLSLVGVQHTTMTFNIESFASRAATYYVSNLNGSIRSPNIGVAAGNTTKTVTVRGFPVNSTSNMVLKRAENGPWITQKIGTDLLTNLPVTTKGLDVATSVASQSAMAQWDQAYDGANYEVSLFDAAPTAGTVAIQVKDNAGIPSSGGSRNAIFAGLEMDTQYWGRVTVSEINSSGVAQKILVDSFNLETSEGAVMQVGEIQASNIKLSWNAGDVEEADGVADFIVKSRIQGSGSSPAAVTPWLPDSTSFATIPNLAPGKTYVFFLFRKGLDGQETFQVAVTATTKSSVLTVTSTASSSISVEWTNLYPNAQYQLTYGVTGEDSAVFGDGPMTDTSALLTGLESNTEYTIELYVIENGVPVGVATSKLGNSLTVSTGVSPVLIGGAVVVTAVVVGVVIMKVKAAKVAAAAIL